MYISIRREDMKVLHKHKVAAVVCDLVWIEARNNVVDIVPIDFDYLKRYTNLELTLLLRNISGQDVKLTRQELKKQISDLVELYPETDANAFEVNLQASKINDEYVYKYVKGSSVAQRVG